MTKAIDKTFLKEQAGNYGISIQEEELEKFYCYSHMLVEWNGKVNLTAITEPEKIVVKHFLDSLLLLRFLPEKPYSLIDVGTGAGFPGIPLAIMRKDMRLTLLDSLNKRLLFLKELCEAIEIPVNLVHARAEDAGRSLEYREQYDVATARAVAALPVLCEYCLPLVKKGGCFIAMKGPESDEEILESKKAIELLGGKQSRIENFELNGEEKMERRIIVIGKFSATPPKNPRISAKINKQHL